MTRCTLALLALATILPLAAYPVPDPPPVPPPPATR
jgi:hypothetical protein